MPNPGHHVNNPAPQLASTTHQVLGEDESFQAISDCDTPLNDDEVAYQLPQLRVEDAPEGPILSSPLSELLRNCVFTLVGLGAGSLGIDGIRTSRMTRNLATTATLSAFFGFIYLYIAVHAGDAGVQPPDGRTRRVLQSLPVIASILSALCLVVAWTIFGFGSADPPDVSTEVKRVVIVISGIIEVLLVLTGVSLTIWALRALRTRGRSEPEAAHA